MPLLKRLFPKLHRKWRRCDELSSRIASIESRLDKLEDDKAAGIPVVIGHADKVVIERITYSNHLGTIDIDSLSGQLNIGVNCRDAAGVPGELLPFLEKNASNLSDTASSQSSAGTGGPACNIRARPT